MTPYPLAHDIIANDPAHGHEIAQAAGAVFNPEANYCIGRVRDGELLGGVFYEGHNGASIIIHTAGFDPYWLSRDLIWVCFHYPFVQLGVKKLFAHVAETNSQSLEFVQKLGFKKEHRITDVFDDGDLILFGMYREDCRWLSLKPRAIRCNRSSEDWRGEE